VVFAKAGIAFGGGLGILAVLEDELVTRRRAVAREDFLALYGIARIVPSGTMSALAVAYGWRFRRFWGTVVALGAMVLPALVLTIVLTVLYGTLRDGPLFEWLPVTILPAALALIVAAALRLGRDVWRPSFETVLAAAAFVAVLVFDANPALVLVGGGVAGAAGFSLLGRPRSSADQAGSPEAPPETPPDQRP